MTGRMTRRTSTATEDEKIGQGDQARQPDKFGKHRNLRELTDGEGFLRAADLRPASGGLRELYHEQQQAEGAAGPR